MSGSNPYAVNGYGGSSNNNSSNPYGSSGPNPYGGSNRYNDPYLPQNNQSSTSVNSYGSRGERRLDDRNHGRPSVNPYEQRPPRRPSPGPPSASFERSSDSLQTPTAAPGTDPRFGQGPRPQNRGYGGLGPAPPTPTYDRQERQHTPPQRPRTAGREQDREADRERDRDRERERAYSDGRGRDRRNAPDPRDIPPPPPIPAANTMQRQYSPRRPVKSMEEILKHIQRDWKNMEGDECVPIKVALQLMDPSSLGLGEREGDFKETHVDLQRSLKKVVNEQYADFNSAVGTYHKIQACIRDSQSRVRYLKNGLVATRGGILTTNPELRGLAEQSGELDSLLSVLTQMETLREMPTRLEERINEKRWISAIDVLTEALRSCRKSELDGIGAMSDLRNYFSGQETSLVDLLIEELHDHLYLKSPYCVDRWKGRRADGGEKNAKETFGGNTWDRPVYAFLASLDTKQPMIENATKNPELDTFHYIHMLIESLNKLGYLEEAITRIEQRMPVELYKVVDRTNNEIDAKYPSHLWAQLQKENASLRVPRPGDSRTQVLSEFLWTLYAKFEAIAEGHRVLHDVAAGIVKREKLTKPEKYTAGFKELWKLYQMEIRSLLHDYLAANGEITLGKGVTTVAGTDIFTKHRDRNRKIFKLSNLDEKSTDLKAEEQELEEILKSSVPGLVSKSHTNPGLGSSDRHGEDGTAAGHKLLIDPSVFNMTILLPPSLAFLQHLKDIVPTTSGIPISTLSSFLDDFLINVFHPQLEEAVTELCTQCMMDIEANTEDGRWAQYSTHPVFKGTTSFMALVRAFSEMLSSIPQDQMFTQLIITQLVTYYAKCFAYYTSMVSRIAASSTNPNTNTSTLKPAAALADSGEVHDVILDLLASGEDRPKQKELNRKGVQLLLAAVKTSPLSAYDIISDPKSVYHLSLLYNSMQWLASSLSMLRHIESGASSRKTAHSRNSSQANHMNVRRWTLITTLQTPNLAAGSDHVSSVYLPLTPETAVAFDKTVQSFRELAEQSLLTLYLDVRCGIIHQLGRALRPVEAENVEGPQSPAPAVRASSTSLVTDSSPALTSGAYPFVLPSPPTSASPRILELNNDLISFDANISSYLGIKERTFILTGLGTLVDRYLIVGADHIQVMNKEGAERMRVDAMVIQQVLRGLGVSHKKPASNMSDNDKSASNGVGLGISATVDPSSKQEGAIDEDNLLTTSSQYYELFLRGPEAIMRSVKDRKDAKTSPPGDHVFTYDELRTLIELCFSAAIKSEDREESIRARRKMDDLLLQLGEVMWDS